MPWPLYVSARAVLYFDVQETDGFQEVFRTFNSPTGASPQDPLYPLLGWSIRIKNEWSEETLVVEHVTQVAVDEDAICGEDRCPVVGDIAPFRGDADVA